MFSPINFWLATTAIVIILVCYILILAKLKPANESSEFAESLQETYEELSVQRRSEMLEKIKEERIKEYLDRKRRKIEDS
jgi:bifunctional DNA-binding transcriptional regulator/antitoxin component of YhaV-PrlF toxin-antitoxin module